MPNLSVFVYLLSIKKNQNRRRLPQKSLFNLFLKFGCFAYRIKFNERSKYLIYFKKIMMNRTVGKGCEDCTKTKNCCVKTCFIESEANIFQQLESKELEFLISGKQQICYKAGETIIKQNTTSTFVVCMKSGFAKVYVEGEKGKNLVVKIAGNGDFISGGGLFNGNVQHFTISALTDVNCCLIDSSVLTKLFAENNRFAIDLLRNHTKQNNYLLTKMVSLTQKYMPGRVADTLLYLRKEIYKQNPFTTKLTRQDLSEMSNMTKESLVRILHQFKNSKLIKTEQNTIEILDEDSLSSIIKTANH